MSLSEDMVLEGDYELATGTINLNGHSLTIIGNLTQSGGCIALQEGKLWVQGDYCTIENNRKIPYLSIKNAKDYLLVDGNFDINSNYDNWSNGTIELKKNININRVEFSNNLTVRISGEETQNVICNNSYGFRRLIIENPKAVDSIKSLHIMEYLDTKGIKVSCPLYLNTGATVSGNIYHGDVIYYSGDITNSLHVGGNVTLSNKSVLKTNLIVDGDVTSQYELEIKQGSLICDGLRVKNLKLSSDDAQVRVNSDCEILQASNNTNGILEIKGNLTVETSYSTKLNWSGTRVLCSGEALQEIQVPTDFMFGTVELQNPERVGVYFNTYIGQIEELIANKVPVFFINKMGIDGWTLEEDTILEGNLNLTGGTMDLNGYALTVKGDMYVQEGTLKINGGTLTVEGDLRFQMISFDEAGRVDSVNDALSYIRMDSAKDYVLVKGDFFMQSLYSNSIEKGTLEVKGDYNVIAGSGGNFNVFSDWGQTVILSGEKKQRINIRDAINQNGRNVYTYSNAFDRLIIENTSEEGVTVNHNIIVHSELTDMNNKLHTRYVVQVDKLSVITAEEIDASINVAGINLKNNLRINGNLNCANSSYYGSDYNSGLHGFDLTANNINLYVPLVLDGGSLHVRNNLNVYSNGLLKMTNENDYAQVKGNYNINLGYNVSGEGYLTAGVLEIAGDVFQKNDDKPAIAASGTHTIIFTGKSGEEIQKIEISSSNHFQNVILWRDEKYYSFTPELNELCDNYDIQYKDEIAPEAVIRLVQKDISASGVTLSWNAATDNNQVVGYEIYRNNKKIGVTTNTTYTDCGLQPERTYEYYVLAYDKQRNLSDVGERLTIQTLADTTEPTSPIGLKFLSRTGSSITVSWMAATDDVGIKGYNIYRDGEVVGKTSAGLLIYKDYVLEKGVLYEYTITSFDAAGNESNPSEAIKIAAMNPEITGISPANNKIIGGGKTTIRLDYKGYGDSNYHAKLEYCDSSMNENNWISAETTICHVYDSSGVHINITWDYRKVTPGNCLVRISLFDSDNNSSCKEFTYYIDNEGPEAVCDIKADSDNGVAWLSWSPSKSSDVKNYQVYRSCDGQAFSLIKEGLTSCSFTDATVKVGETYWYQILGVDCFEQKGKFSESVEITITQDEEQPVVKLVSCDGHTLGNGTNIKLKATDNRQVSKIRLYYCKEKESEWTLANPDKQTADGNGEVLFYFDTSELEEGTYLIKVEAEDASENISKSYEGTIIVDHTGISPVEIQQVIPSATYVTIKWKDVIEDDLAYFVVEQEIDGVFERVKIEKATLGCYIDGLVPNQEYVFRVIGYDNVGNRGMESEEIRVVTTVDKEAPIITSFEPSYQREFSETIPLAIEVKDNHGVTKLELSYSYDAKNWNEIVVIEEAYRDSIQFVYPMDVSELEEGEVWIAAKAYDEAGNVSNCQGEVITRNYIIDHTAPDMVSGLKIEGNTGHIVVSWNAVEDKGIAYYQVYRCDNEEGIFNLYRDHLRTLYCIDGNIKAGNTYQYKVRAVDVAGNMGMLSDAVSGEAKTDMTAPEVGLSLRNNQIIGEEVKIFGAAMDDSCVKKIVVEYRAMNAEQAMWNEIYNNSFQEMSVQFEMTWKLSGIPSGTYEVRIIAQDGYQHTSEPYVVKVCVDKTAPDAPVLEAKSIGYGIELNWSNSKAEDLSHYQVFRKAETDNEYTLLANTKDCSYTDQVQEIKTYEYKVSAVDAVGNTVDTEVITITPLEEDHLAPTADCAEEYTSAVGRKVRFDASSSRDNVGIVKYVWNMGNGDVLEGAVIDYNYSEVGTYYGMLSVVDAAGNTGTKSFAVRVLDATSGVLQVTVVGEQNGKLVALPYANIAIENNFKKVSNYKADNEGNLAISLMGGNYKIAVYHDGFLPQNYEVVVENGKEVQQTLQLQSGKLVTGNIETHRLTLEEIKERNIDVQDPLNWYEYRYEFSYWAFGGTMKRIWVPLPAGGGTVFVSDGGTVTSLSGAGGSGNVGGSGTSENAQGNKKGYYITVFENGWTKLITTYRYEEYLKKMYMVNVSVTNNAEDGYGFDIIESYATLNLPEGLSQVVYKNDQRLKASLGRIDAQKTKETSWIIRADEPGRYKLSVSFDGILLPFNEDVQAVIEADEPFVVSEDEENTFCDEGFLTGEEHESYKIKVVGKDKKAIRGVYVTLLDEDKKCIAITNGSGVATLYVNKNETRHFELQVECTGYEDLVICNYSINKEPTSALIYWNDTIILYKNGEDQGDDAPADNRTMPSNPRTDINGNMLWDCVYFGHYYQNDTNDDGVANEKDEKEAIKWRVLSVQDGYALLMADQCLDAKAYNEKDMSVSWGNSTIRSWLNGYNAEDNACKIDYGKNNFINTAFFPYERDFILDVSVDYEGTSSNKLNEESTKDKISLLTINQASSEKYGFASSALNTNDARKTKNTAYALAKGASNINGLTKYEAAWWLRTINTESNKAPISYEGLLDDNGEWVSKCSVSIRPILYLQLDSDVWEYAGLVSSDGNSYEDADDLPIKIKLDSDDGAREFSIFQDDSLFLNTSLEYNHTIARYAMGLSMLVYGSEQNQVKEGFQELGFSKPSNICFYPDTSTTADITGEGLYSPCWIASKEIEGEKDVVLVVVAIRGTYHEEWIDNFNPGISDVHEGFQRAGEYVYKNLFQYISDREEELAGKKIKVLVTGHSRGAAAANLVGKMIDDAIKNNTYAIKCEKQDVFVYTYATPNTAKDAKIQSGYGNIYNIVNPEDFVTKVLLSKWGYSRYGTTYVLPSKTTDSSDFYRKYLNEVQRKVSSYREEKTEYKPYQFGMVEVSTYLVQIYWNVRNISDYYNKSISSIGEENRTLKELYTGFLGYFKSGNPIKEKLAYLFISDAYKKVYGQLGLQTALYFTVEEVGTSNFSNAHFQDTYLAAINTISKEDLLRDRKMLMGIVNCPVDINLMNKNGNVVGIIENNEVVSIKDNSIVLYIDEDSKMFCIPSNGDYTIQLVGNDDGVMNYSLCLVDPDCGETERIYYEELPVTKGEAYVMEYSANETLDNLFLKNQKGEVVPLTAKYSEEELGSLSYEVHVEGIGTADSLYNITPGDYVKLQAYCDDNNEFLGWYDDADNLVCSELLYAFSAKESAEFTAKFTNVVVDVTAISVSESIIEMEQGEVSFNEVTILPANATYQYCSYESSDEDVVTVDLLGIITAVGYGEADVTITSYDKNAKATYHVIVKGNPKEIIFDPNGGTISTLNNEIFVSQNGKAYKTVYEHCKYGILPDVVSENYIFEGWFTEAEGGERITPETIVVDCDTQTLYAHWSKKNTSSGSESGKDTSGESSGTESGSTSENKPSKDGDGVSDNKPHEKPDSVSDNKPHEESDSVSDNKPNKEPEESSDTISENECKKVIVSFDFMSGKADVVSATVEYQGKYGKLPNAERNGYVFDGWYTTSENGIQVTEASTVTISQNHILYARWSYIELSVKQKYDITTFFADVENMKGYILIEGKGLATISRKGILTAKKSGEVVLCPYRMEGKKKVLIEDIEPLHLIIQKPTISGKLMLTIPEQSMDLNDYLHNIPRNSNNIKWTIRASKKPIVTLSGENGNIITPVRNGKAKVTAEIINDQGYVRKISMMVTVKMPKPVNTNVTLKVNQSKKLKFRYLTGQDIQWKSENPEIATVDEGGKVTGVSSGETVIVVIINGVEYKINLEVMKWVED